MKKKSISLLDTDAWYHEAVDYAEANGLMNGTGATTFEPAATTGQATLVTILWRLKGEPQARIKLAGFTGGHGQLVY